MIRLISYGIVGASRAALAASWLALATAGAANADDFDHGFTAYLGGNYTQSFRVWRPLAEAGEVEAQFGLGLLYERGRGAPRDLAEAAAWYARAAGQGSMRAQTQLGGMYARGDGVPADWGQAIAWWERAAAQGSMRAQFLLGQSYHFGSGVGHDLDKAVQWYDKAAAQGYRPAALQIQEINRLREAEAAAAVAAATPETEPDSAGSSSVLLSLTVPRSKSVLLESAVDLKTRDAASLIALGIGSAQPLDEAMRIYLASYRSIQKASEGWQAMAEANSGLLGGLSAAVAQADLGRDKGIVYRLQAGPLADTEAANALCYRLSRRGVHCLVVTP